VPITKITDAAEARDGIAPLDEATWLALRHRPQSVRRWERADGFALLIGTELSLVVAPEARGRGLGGALLGEVLADVGDALGPLSAWSHGDHPAAAALARRTSFDRVRELWVMRRPLSGLPPLPALPEVTIRSYRPADDDALLRVNAAAFATHPEQGAMDAANLAERMGEPWFDPEGLLLAVDSSGALLGFHWTKQHSAALGEVYVVGIDPAAQGRGLGKLLTLAGLHHLADRGMSEVLLYVESDNHPAVATYTRLGFERAETHVMYRRG